MSYKDLTWEDIRLIVQIADNTLEETDKKELLAFGQQGYYSSVLKKVTAIKEAQTSTNKGK